MHRTSLAVIGFLFLSDARAATFQLQPDIAPAGGTIEFSITTELAGWPAVSEGAEFKSGLVIEGPCSNAWGGAAPPGSDIVVPFPGVGWSPSRCVSLRPGSYVATLYYRRYDDTPVVGSTEYRIDLAFTVEMLELQLTPRNQEGWTEIPVGETVLIDASGITPSETVTSLQVLCPDGTVDSALDVSPVDEGFSIAWPGPFFAGACDSTQPGGYHVSLLTDQQSTTAWFSVFGDRDGDGWLDGDDNCPNIGNPGQEDADGDRRGDVCDDDRDNDGRLDDRDNCPDVRNASQVDIDEDGLGDACDSDADADGVTAPPDNCPLHSNPGQENDDGDPFGNLCDPDPEDADNDGANDLLDNCPTVFNPGQQDLDLDGIGTACDPDIDGDGIANDEEWAAGTDPLDYQALDPGINEFFDGAPIEPGGTAVDGEPVGVVMNPVSDSSSVDVSVVDPFGDTYLEETLIPQSPVVFWFVPIWPGRWRIDADANNGEIYSATIDVAPEPGSFLSAAASLAALAAVSKRGRCQLRGRPRRRSELPR